MRGFGRILALLVLMAGTGQAALLRAMPVRLSVLDFGKTGTSKLASQAIASALGASIDVTLLDRDLTRAAARGAGYSDSLNMSLAEARDLGAALGCDFYLIGDAQTLRRSPSTGAAYFEAYATIFLVSSRTGRLIVWERPSFQAVTREAAEQMLLAELATSRFAQIYLAALRLAVERERQERETAIEHTTPVIEDAPEQTDPGSPGLRLPRPLRRLKPPYPESAARAGAEGTVDVLVELDNRGEVASVEVARWAGFGLDEATVNTVRQLHFFPAMRDGLAIPMRVLLRYNFGQASIK